MPDNLAEPQRKREFRQLQDPKFRELHEPAFTREGSLPDDSEERESRLAQLEHDAIALGVEIHMAGMETEKEMESLQKRIGTHLASVSKPKFYRGAIQVV